ncbi:hypothetical protein NWF32_12790 [Pseudomonas qingdaonensis]|nr:hypothetical protein [Pseudomonas qingdaonensis]
MQRLKTFCAGLALASLTGGAAMAASLVPGHSVSGAIGQGRQPVWTVPLKAGDFVQGRVEGDVSVRLLDADGQPVRLLVDGLDMVRDFMFIAPTTACMACAQKPSPPARRLPIRSS